MEIYDALDLSEGEKKVYKALVELKDTTTGPLYQSSGVSQSKVYEILDRLKKKGLATYIIKEGRKYWHPANPSIYLDKLRKDIVLAKQKEEILQKGLPTLMKLQDNVQDEAQVFLGFNGFRSALNSLQESFSSGDELLVFGSPEVIEEPYYSYLIAYNKDRVRRKVKGRWLYGSHLRAFASERMYKLPLTKVKYIDGMTPTSLAIGKDRIILIGLHKDSKTFVIMSKDLAKSFRAFFESLWMMAKD